MLLARALYASTSHAGVPAGFGGTPGIVNENTPHYHLELQYHDGRAHRPDKRLLLRLPPSPRRGAHSPGTSSANLKTGVGAPSEGAHGPPRESPLGPRVILRRRGAGVKRRDARSHGASPRPPPVA
jgi:hypothetical protein